MQSHPRPRPEGRQAKVRLAPPEPTTLAVALDYHARGYCPIPQRPGAKKPCVVWKPYQDEQPGEALLERWFADQFPEAGIALILGPAFHLLVVDVDGRGAYDALVGHLGGEPVAPTVLSGSGDPHRRHYYFRHPPVVTKAKHCPWDAGLELRGHRGIVVAPPSRHRSGNCYRWAEGRSLADLPPPEVPGPILAALREQAARLSKADSPAGTHPGTPTWPSPSNVVTTEQADRLAAAGLCRETRRFLAGIYAEGPQWNDRLFRTAADMAGCAFAQRAATPLLIKGAAPWDDREKQVALRTIASAYDEDRQPACVQAAAGGGTPYIARNRFSFRIDAPHLD